MDDVKAVMATINWDKVAAVGENILAAIAIMILGVMASKWADKFIRVKLPNYRGSSADDTARPLLATIARYTILLITFYMVLTILNIPTASFLAAFGAAGLAIGLAMQGTLSNVAAGVMLVFLRSMDVGDYILTPKVEGTVLEISFFTTKIKTPDGVYMIVPNAEIWASEIRNYSRFRTRRADISIDVDINNDLQKALDIVRSTVSGTKVVINSSTASVIILAISGHAVTLQARCWFKAGTFREDSSAMYQAIHTALAKANIKWPEQCIKRVTA